MMTPAIDRVTIGARTDIRSSSFGGGSAGKSGKFAMRRRDLDIAVIGVVKPAGGGERAKTEDQPYAKQTTGQIAHAPEPALPSSNAGRGAVPVARDAERTLPNARRPVAGRSERQ